jgi:hypothetical protein
LEGIVSTERPPAIILQSLTRRIVLSTPLDDNDETAWIALLVPEGSTDAQVLEWAEMSLPPGAVAELREVIKREAGEQP